MQGGGTHNEVREDESDVDAKLLCLLSERLGPSLEEGLGAGVGGEHGRGDESDKGAEGEDETGLSVSGKQEEMTGVRERDGEER